jgi:hypothetical protein
MLNFGDSVLMRLFSSSSASASADHVTDAGAIVAPLKVAADALLEVARLAHVEQLALHIEIAINPWQTGQCGHLAEQLIGEGRFHRPVLWRRRCGMIRAW